MLKVAVVDDEMEERKTLLQYYELLKIKEYHDLDIYTYESGDEFLEKKEGPFDLVCLDIDMKGLDGISTAKEIRKSDSQVMIIFVTNMAQMAIRGYEVQALDFVVKPVNYYSFALKMKNAFDMIRSRVSKSIVLPTAGGMQRISADDIYYVEVSGHYVFYHTKEGLFRQKSSMKEAEEKLAGLCFRRCNNCYLVNLQHVECVNKDDLRVNGDWLKISRPRKKEFLQSLANYMGGIHL